MLVEKYIYKNHPRKLKTLSYILTAKEVEYLKKGRKKRKCQPPDLFVYKPKDKEFFFVEVKRDTDHMRKPQEKFFKDIEKKLGCKVLICDLKAVK